jgi:hypothetical protein
LYSLIPIQQLVFQIPTSILNLPYRQVSVVWISNTRSYLCHP